MGDNLRRNVWIAGGLATFALIVVMIYAPVIWSVLDWPENELPPQLAVTEVLHSRSNSGGFLEGCAYAEYRLSPETTKSIRRLGLRFFDNVSQPPHQKRNPFGPWRETPIPKEPDLFALGAQNGCQDTASEEGSHPTIRLRLDQSGSFYSYTHNEEGLIVVDAKQGIAVYMYFG